MPGYRDKGKSITLPTPRSEGDILSSPHLKAFTFNELKNATRNFRPDSLLGQGGFGNVYKGWIDDQTLGAAKPGSGMVVAVKKLKPDGIQGHKEWLVRCSLSTLNPADLFLHRSKPVKISLFFIFGSLKSIILAKFIIQILSNSLDSAWMGITGFLYTSICPEAAWRITCFAVC